MIIQRPYYLNKLIKRRLNGMPKVITGVRRCGKSYLLAHLYRDYLLSQGVDDDHIIDIALDDIANRDLRDGMTLYRHIKSKISSTEEYYLFLDEVQYASDFSDVINGLSRIDNLDIYVTGSNSRFLSNDILTEFRGRGDEIRVYPLSFSEYYSAVGGDKTEAWVNYRTFGGMPVAVTLPDNEARISYLENLFSKVYISDVIERNAIRSQLVIEPLTTILASAVGSLTNPTKIADTFHSELHQDVAVDTIKKYIEYLSEAFLINRAERYDVKGRKYISTPSKYYYVDAGLRNARLEFRQPDESHVMENIIYNELRLRDFKVDVGVVDVKEMNRHGERRNVRLETDFVVNKGFERLYIQSALEMNTPEKYAQEKKSLIKINDSFRKVIITREATLPYYDEDGIMIIGLYDFLLNPDSLKF